jgi:hypothetical protein
MAMRCKDYSVKQIMVGLYQLGLVGLSKALKGTAERGLSERDDIVDHLISVLEGENYIPDRENEEFRIALWREYLRHTGGDFSPFFSRVDVTVRGEPGERRDEFVEMAFDVFAEHELTPVIEFVPSGGGEPELLIDGAVVVAGVQRRPSFNAAVRKSFSDW